jgi:transcriptional regulator with XRE-family HTH domain
MEKLAYESDLGSKGYLSDVEQGLSLPSLTKLKLLADRLEVELLDLVTFPTRSRRQALVDATRKLEAGEAARLLAEVQRPRK